MTNVQSVSRIKRPDRGVILTAVILVLIYALVFVLEQILPPTSMLFTVLKKRRDLRAGRGVDEPAQRLYRPVFRWARRASCSSGPTPTAF